MRLKFVYLAPWDYGDGQPSHTFECKSENQDNNHWGQRAGAFIEAFDEVVDWCNEQFGIVQPNGLWLYNRRGYFWFKDESHAMAFRLRWF
ncbi:MAG: hypothetical protein EOP83_35455 [Verrucomicrobiaceae bacterium]|nr:MAG: hypothetical protein EOP83_35455 [Verrucomicrobiaceae bacterium]